MGNPDILYWPGARKDTYAIGFRYSGDSLNTLITNLQGQLSYLKGAGGDDENGKDIAISALSTLIGLPLDILTSPVVAAGLAQSVYYQLQKGYQARIDRLTAEIMALQQVQANGGEAIFLDVVVRGHTELQTLPGGLSGGGFPPFVSDNSFLPDGGNVFSHIQHAGVFLTTTLSASQAVSQVCVTAAIGDLSSPGIC